MYDAHDVIHDDYVYICMMHTPYKWYMQNDAYQSSTYDCSYKGIIERSYPLQFWVISYDKMTEKIAWLIGY